MAESDGLPGPRQRHRATASASARADVSYPRKRRSLLCISQSFSPDTTPTAIRASKLLEHLSAQWDIVVLTEAERPSGSDQPRVEVVRSWRPTRLIAAMRRLRLGKLLELLVWPDESIFWTAPAFLAGRRLIRELEPSAIVVFMMPYSAGLVGIALSRLSGLPLILNLDDSPTCTDMHPYFPTPMHYRLAKALEDFYARSADAVVYVSQTNLDTVSARQPEHVAEKFHLVRYGADRADSPPQDTRADHFEIAYVGAMSGWWTLIGRHASAGGLKRAYVAWNRLGRYELVALDQRTSSPAVIGRAIMDTFTAHPGWEGHVNLMIYGNPYPEPVVERAMASAGVQGVVNVLGPFPHDSVTALLDRSDLLFITLPKRLDGSPGGRISAKTYEYLMTDRPILAAVPRGENWDYLADKPGVWLVEPDDREGMTRVIDELAEAKFAGRALAFDRSHLRDQLAYEGRAAEFAAVVRSAITGRYERRRSPQTSS